MGGQEVAAAFVVVVPVIDHRDDRSGVDDDHSVWP